LYPTGARVGAKFGECLSVERYRSRCPSHEVDITQHDMANRTSLFHARRTAVTSPGMWAWFR